MESSSIQISEPEALRFLFSDTRIAWLWLLVRLYAGHEWIMAGCEKATSAVWVGAQAGTGIQRFL